MEFTNSKSRPICLWNLLLPNGTMQMFIPISGRNGVTMNKNKHLTLNDRQMIQTGLVQHLSFKSIGREIGKDCTTVSKEIRNHIRFEKTGAFGRPFNDCTLRRRCPHKKDLCDDCAVLPHHTCSFCTECYRKCPDYQKEECPELQKPPYVCNGCDSLRKCTLEKHVYDARYAQNEYSELRTESRSGFNLSEEERTQLDSIISPLLKNGHSLHHILVNNPDTIMYCEKTLYAYLNSSLFSARNLDAPRIVKFRPRKKKSVQRKVDKKCTQNRTFEDFTQYMLENPSLPVVELDSVEGVRGGAVLLTLHFVRQKLQLAFHRKMNDSQSVIDIFNELYSLLGRDLYMKLFPVLLADNGSEFSNPSALEFDEEGNPRSRVFYCHPSSPHEKGSCEVNHEFIRRVLPKGIDIGQFTPAQISLMMDHINSYSRPELGDKTPYAMFEFYYGKAVLDKLGLTRIPPNEIILKPSLLSPTPANDTNG